MHFGGWFHLTAVMQRGGNLLLEKKKEKWRMLCPVCNVIMSGEVGRAALGSIPLHQKDHRMIAIRLSFVPRPHMDQPLGAVLTVMSCTVHLSTDFHTLYVTPCIWLWLECKQGRKYLRYSTLFTVCTVVYIGCGCA
jgi:hypothetical protein